MIQYTGCDVIRLLKVCQEGEIKNARGTWRMIKVPDQKLGGIGGQGHPCCKKIILFDPEEHTLKVSC